MKNKSFYLFFLIILFNNCFSQENINRLFTDSFSLDDTYTMYWYLDHFPDPLSAEISLKNDTLLNKIVSFLNDNKKINLQICSHTDYRGEICENIEISNSGAKWLADYLNSKFNTTRVSYIGYGESCPLMLQKDYIHKGILKFSKGITLSETFIKSLSLIEDQEIANALNRRYEIKLIEDSATE